MDTNWGFKVLHENVYERCFDKNELMIRETDMENSDIEYWG